MRPTLLIDEAVFGLDQYLKDLGWKTKRRPAQTEDDEIVEVAKSQGYVIVSPDSKLLKRCRVLGIPTCEIRFEDLARTAHDSLARKYPE